MAAYIVVDVQITDPVRYDEYRKLTPASIAGFGGKFIVRGGAVQVMEGDWQPGRVVIVEFPDADTARAWWSSDGYAPAKAIRQAASITRMILVEGV